MRAITADRESGAPTKNGILQRFFGSEDVRQSELAQTRQRLILGPIIACYLWIGVSQGWLGGDAAPLVQAYLIGFLLIAVALHIWVLRKPGILHSRRAMAMALDYGSLTFVLAVGGEYTIPIYATLLWITVGYGMRYGQIYLVIGTTLALTSLAILSIASSYWSSHPFLLAAVTISVLVVPLYACVLLEHLRIAHDAAVAANRAKSRFLAQASHDLRQPVHAISLFTACLRDSRLSRDQSRMVDNIDRSLNSVIRLFRSLLDISTLDSGKVRPSLEPIPINQLFQDIIGQNREAARCAGVRFRVVPSTLVCTADLGLMTTILQNLVSNTIKYAPGSEVLLGCRRRRDGRFAIWICDRGPGIPLHEQSKVFEEFYRSLAHGRDVEGVGLGLSIVRRLAALMGFRVELKSTAGQGTRVAIEGLESTVEVPRAAQKLSPTPVAPLRGLRVLLIEDNPDVLLATRKMLERWGCRVQAAQRFPEMPVPCDMIITDYDLNGPLTGAECIKRIRELSRGPVPAIIITGHDVSRIEELLDDKHAPLLKKPVRPAELRSAVMSYRSASAEEAA